MSNGLVVGVLGNGEIPKKTAVSLISDRVTGTTPRFVFPVTEEHWTSAVRSVAQWALNREHPYEVILDGSESELEGVSDLVENAATKHKVTAVETKLVNLLAAEGEEAILLLAWNETDDSCQRALAKALAKGVKSYDLLDSLNDLRFDDEPEPEQQPETDVVREREFEDRESAQKAAAADREPAAVLDEAEPPAEPAKRKRRTKAEMEAARAAEAATAAPAVVDSGPITLVATDETADEAQVYLNGGLTTNSNSNGGYSITFPMETTFVQESPVETWLKQLIREAVAEALAK